MSRAAPSSNWIERLQAIVNETIERSAASTAGLQQLLAVFLAPGVDPNQLSAEISRHGQEHGPEAYRQLTEVGMQFLIRSLQLLSRYRDEFLRELIPPSRIFAAGFPPAVPSPPEGTDPAGWTNWYPLYTAWVAEQQAWSARLYQILLEEVRSGAIRPDAVQTTARDYLQRRLPDYVTDMVELNAGLMADLLGVTDGSVGRLSDALGGGAMAVDEITVAVRGTPGTTGVATLLVENSRNVPTLVSCLAAEEPGFGVVPAPVQFQLAPGESRPVTIRVRLPRSPTSGQREAGTMTIRGQGDRDLVVRLRAVVETEIPAEAETDAEAKQESSPEPSRPE